MAWVQNVLLWCNDGNALPYVEIDKTSMTFGSVYEFILLIVKADFTTKSQCVMKTLKKFVAFEITISTTLIMILWWLLTKPT